MSAINSTITTGVTIGGAPYTSPLTITSAGYVMTGPTGGNVITGYNATLVNNGRITETNLTPRYYGVYLGGVSDVFNTGTILSASFGIEFVRNGYLNNTGILSAVSGDGVEAGALSTVINSGLVTASTGLLLQGGGFVDNIGTVIGLAGVNISYDVATVSNTGLIGGTDGYGVILHGGGTVTNSGVIYGSNYYAGIYISGGSGTVIDSGTITVYYSAAIKFVGAGDDLLQLKSSNLLIQDLVSGNGATSRLEFLPGTGTLSGIDAYFTGFGPGTVDAGASWAIEGNVTFGAGIDLTLLGTLSVAGTLENAGSIDPGSTNGVLIAAGGYLRNDVTGVIDNPTAISDYGPAVRGALGLVTVVNYGTIEDPAADISVSLTGGGSVVNGSATYTSALIEGVIGVYAHEDRTTVTNFGSIVGNNEGTGISLVQSGIVTNGAAGSNSALVYGEKYGVFIVDAPGTVVNFGTISSDDYGIRLGHGGTVVDAGLISGGTSAISFSRGNDNLVVLEDGFTIEGGIVVYGAGSTGNILELEGSAAAPVEANYNALGLSGFQTVAFGPGIGNYATLTITSTTQLPGTIARFIDIHNAIDLTALSDANDDAFTSFNTTTGVLTVTGDNGSVQLHLDVPGHMDIGWRASNDGSNGVEVTPLCFCAGTAIATPGGEVPVERLKAGDLVLTSAGQARAITWVGTGRVLATRGRRGAATPVIVRKGAIAPNVPHRDLRVTKAHSLFLDGVLVPVEFLINHRSILWDDHAQEVMLYHVELETHDLLIANGLPAESYRDDGNRWLFQNANEGWGLPSQEPCAPVVTGGPLVDAVWWKLLNRAGSRPETPLTDDPDLHLIIDGKRVNPREHTASSYIFRLPATPASVVVASRAGVPSELGIARDPRALGVALRQVTIRQGAKLMLFYANDERATAGFHGYEPDDNLRWTDGRAVLPIEDFARFDAGAEVQLHLGAATQYPADEAAVKTA